MPARITGLEIREQPASSQRESSLPGAWGGHGRGGPEDAPCHHHHQLGPNRYAPAVPGSQIASWCHDRRVPEIDPWERQWFCKELRRVRVPECASACKPPLPSCCFSPAPPGATRPPRFCARCANPLPAARQQPSSRSRPPCRRSPIGCVRLGEDPSVQLIGCLCQSKANFCLVVCKFFFHWIP